MRSLFFYGTVTALRGTYVLNGKGWGGMDIIRKYGPLIASVILTVVFVFMGFLPKLTGAHESVYMFTMLGINTGLPFEPLGRYALGAAEVLVILLLWLPGKRPLGGALGAFILIGAIVLHVSGIIGIDTQFPIEGTTPPFDATTPSEGDGGTLFMVALVSFALSIYVFLSGRSKLVAES